jgi:hypothetical protein
MSDKNRSKKSAAAPPSPRAVAAKTGTIITTKGIDVGQGKVLNHNNVFSLMYYRYTLMTGVYMLDGIEQAFLHFFILLGMFFVAKYSYGFFLAMQGRGYI